MYYSEQVCKNQYVCVSIILFLPLTITGCAGRNWKQTQSFFAPTPKSLRSESLCLLSDPAGICPVIINQLNGESHVRT